MKRIFAPALLGTLLLTATGTFWCAAADASSASGQLSVGIVILDACRLDAAHTAAGQILAARTGFALTCNKGTDYDVTSDATRRKDAVDGVSTVTVRF